MDKVDLEEVRVDEAVEEVEEVEKAARLTSTVSSCARTALNASVCHTCRHTAAPSVSSHVEPSGSQSESCRLCSGGGGR
ncbi:hypothetical protein AB1Y20_009630 [Prymnesium parvum]|uniref:Uncharacterized protein n=1 Tax=Prymnesium parvum TaxID=97485 RepID=A0AB34K1D1_PRYPA